MYAICNWGRDNVTQWGYTLGACSWRTSQDIGDHFDSMKYNAKLAVSLTNYNGYGPGIGWNDPDMLEVGNGGMSF